MTTALSGRCSLLDVHTDMRALARTTCFTLYHILLRVLACVVRFALVLLVADAKAEDAEPAAPQFEPGKILHVSKAGVLRWMTSFVLAP